MSGTVGRVTQAGLEVADSGGAGEARATAAGLEVLFNDATNVRVTGAGLEVLALDVTDMRVTTAGMEVLYLDSVAGYTQATACLLWRLKLTDGTVLRFAALDVDVTWGGETWLAAAPFEASAAELQRKLAAGQVEVAGLIDNDTITPTDILNGRYDDAEVTVLRIDWSRPSGGAEVLTAGRLGAVSAGPLRFEAEALTPAARLDQPVIEVVSPQCRWVLGDSRCTVNLATYTQAHTITGVASRAQFTASGFTEAAGWANRGRVVFTSGPNAGAARDVRSHETGGVITLWEPLVAVPQVGDGFTVTAGCNRTVARCRDFFANLVNFGGFPQVKGEDSAGRYPDAR